MWAYSAKNRSAEIRIPYVSNPKGRRVGVSFPDSTANPYLACAAMLRAGLDGIKNKSHPGEPVDQDLYDSDTAGIPKVSGMLHIALEELDADREFLKKGGVFTDEVIDSFIELKMQEVTAMRASPQSLEFDLYYSC